MNYRIIYSFENWKHQYIVYLIGNVWFCDEIVVISERKRCMVQKHQKIHKVP